MAKHTTRWINQYNYYHSPQGQAVRKEWNKKFRWRTDLWTLYRITPERFMDMLEQQNGFCPCGTKIRIPTRPQRGNRATQACVDHDHKCCPTKRSCGKCIRGLVCYKCNQAIGLLRDSPELFRTMANWIERARNK